MGKKPSTVRDGQFLGTVLIDKREKHPYQFEDLNCDKSEGGGPLVVPTESTLLASGDYSLKGFEDQVTIERKSLSDLYGTIGQGRDRFERELERLTTFSYAMIIIEATWQEVIVEPPSHTQLPPKIVFRSILAWSIRYGVPFFPAGPRRLAEITTFRLLQKFFATTGEASNG